MRTRRTLTSTASLWLLAAAIPAVAGAADPELGLAEAVRQALEANLDLAAQRRALAADREQIGIARSALLPQAKFGVRGQILDSDRSDDYRGDITKESVTVSAGITQVLYDETDWADFGIQKHVYAGQVAQLESFQLGVIQDAANAFLELDRSRAVVDIQERNRELTARNLETSRARIAAGWSSQRAVLRWESQLASNDISVVQARTDALASRFELNRVRNQPTEAPITALPVGIEEYGFVYSRPSIAAAIAVPEGDRSLRNLLVGIGLERSPALVSIDAAIAAEERLLTSNRRAFWAPSVILGAGVNYLATGGSNTSSFNETEWTLGAGLSLPLLEGGARFAELRQTGDNLASLRFQRRATAQSLDQGIRAAVARASGSYRKIGFARQQEAAAGRNYELVNESYVLGVASILGLLDAQSQLLTANQAVTEALYDFLEDLIAAEQQMALYPFLEPEAEMQQLLDRLEQQLRAQP